MKLFKSPDEIIDNKKTLMSFSTTSILNLICSLLKTKNMKSYFFIFMLCSFFMNIGMTQVTPSCSPCTDPWVTETDFVDLSQTYAPNCRVVVEYKWRMCNGVPEFEIISITPSSSCQCITYADLANINDHLRQSIINDFYNANYYGLVQDCFDYLTIHDFFESSCYYPEQVPLDPEVITWLEENAQGEAWSTTVTQWKPCDAMTCCEKETNMCLKTNPRTGRKYLFIYENIITPVECELPAPDGSPCWPTCGYPQPPVPRLTQDEVLEKDQIKLFPNPVMEYDQISIVFETKKAGLASIYIYNLKGELVSEESIETVEGLNNYSWMFGSLSTGTYFIHVDNGATIKTAKLLVFTR